MDKKNNEKLYFFEIFGKYKNTFHYLLPKAHNQIQYTKKRLNTAKLSIKSYSKPSISRSVGAGQTRINIGL
jgi:surface antigen